MIKARQEGGKVYVHCVQGISRSSTICIAYMIFTEGITFAEGYKRVKERRQCANPNMTFIAQLDWFYKRMYDQNFKSLPVSPRVFCLLSHQTEDPQRIVCKLMLENLYQNNSTTKSLDPRGMFIVIG